MPLPGVNLFREKVIKMFYFKMRASILIFAKGGGEGVNHNFAFGDEKTNVPSQTKKLRVFGEMRICT